MYLEIRNTEVLPTIMYRNNMYDERRNNFLSWYGSNAGHVIFCIYKKKQINIVEGFYHSNIFAYNIQT